MPEELQKHRDCKYCVITQYDDSIANPDSIWGTPRIKVVRTYARCHRHSLKSGGTFPYINNPDNLGCGEFEPRKIDQ